MACVACYLGLVVGLGLTVGQLMLCPPRHEHSHARHIHPLAAVLGAAMYVAARLLLEKLVVPMTANLVML